MGKVRLSDHQEAGRILVEPMDNSRPAYPADAREAVAKVGDQGVDERASPIAWGGMHDEPRRLIDNEQLFILVNDRERDVLRFRLSRHRRGYVERDRCTRVNTVVRLNNRPTRDGDVAGENKRLQVRSGQFCDAGGEHAIEALAPLAYLDRKSFKTTRGLRHGVPLN